MYLGVATRGFIRKVMQQDLVRGNCAKIGGKSRVVL